MVESEIVTAMIMQLNSDCDFDYKEGYSFDPEHDWWDKNENKVYPVLLNFQFWEDSLIGYAKNLRVNDKNQVIADIYLRKLDEDERQAVDKAVFAVSIKGWKEDLDKKGKIIGGYIDAVGTISRRRYPYMQIGQGEWKTVGKEKIENFPAFPGLVRKKGEVPVEKDTEEKNETDN